MPRKKPIYEIEPEINVSTGEAIDTFRGEWDFLSNFYAHSIEVEGMTYPTTEHAFQALKTYESAERYQVQMAPTPGSAKVRGRKVTLRPDWDEARFAAMEAVLHAKFADPALRAKLLATGDRVLIEGNTWRDTTWGCVRDNAGDWKGENALGKLLMKLRDELQNKTATDARRHPESMREALIATALAARQNAYSPYSKYKVGASIQTSEGHILGGCNVENASYGLSNCAERTAIFAAVAQGIVHRDAPLRAVAVVTEDGGTPCGACRQVLAEFAPRDGAPLPILLCDASGSVVRETSLAELLPLAFTLDQPLGDGGTSVV